MKPPIILTSPSESADIILETLLIIEGGNFLLKKKIIKWAFAFDNNNGICHLFQDLVYAKPALSRYHLVKYLHTPSGSVFNASSSVSGLKALPFYQVYSSLFLDVLRCKCLP